jgi:hypothetical protein
MERGDKPGRGRENLFPASLTQEDGQEKCMEEKKLV